MDSESNDQARSGSRWEPESGQEMPTQPLESALPDGGSAVADTPEAPGGDAAKPERGRFSTGSRSLAVAAALVAISGLAGIAVGSAISSGSDVPASSTIQQTDTGQGQGLGPGTGMGQGQGQGRGGHGPGGYGRGGHGDHDHDHDESGEHGQFGAGGGANGGQGNF